MQSLNQKLENAAYDLASSVDRGCVWFRGLTQDTKVLPSGTVAVVGGPEFPQDSGNFTLALGVEIRTNADDTTATAHANLCETAIGPFMSDALASELSSFGVDFHCLGISNRQSNHGIEERQFVTTLTMDVYCCGKSLT